MDPKCGVRVWVEQTKNSQTVGSLGMMEIPSQRETLNFFKN